MRMLMLWPANGKTYERQFINKRCNLKRFQPMAVIKAALIAMKPRVKLCANQLYPPRDGSEKYEGFPRGARETMVARYK
jgi:hypothetical protein